jgi:hypothetical protein
MRNHNHDSNFVVSAAEAAEGIDDDRRALMGLAVGSLAGAIFGLPPTAAQAAGGIGIVGAASSPARLAKSERNSMASAISAWPSRAQTRTKCDSTTALRRPR